MRKNSVLASLASILIILLFIQGRWKNDLTTASEPLSSGKVKSESHEVVPEKILPKASLTIPVYSSQTFNNCGPATLSMVLTYWGKHISQEELGQILRPYQVPRGNNDDKSVTLTELAQETEKRGFLAYHRPNGNLDKIKQFVSAGIPVTVRMWLSETEDIGHYRIIKGYNDETNTITHDDSLKGPNLTLTYTEFNNLWQGFNYEYLIIVPKERASEVGTILGDELDSKTAWEKAYDRSQKETAENPQNPYPYFNLSVASYYLGNYAEAVKYFEKVYPLLPNRMLWYQIEPIKAYLMLGAHEKVLALTSSILANNNRAFSELYLLRGESYLQKNEKAQAKIEFEKAYRYNLNLQAAKDALQIVS